MGHGDSRSYTQLHIMATTSDSRPTSSPDSARDPEKADDVTHNEAASAVGSPVVKGLDEDEEFTPAEQRKIIHRIDRRLISTTGIMYCISLMDRTNLSAAAIAGMLVDLELVQTRYNIITLVFFITYVIFQPPATVLCRKIGPRPFLASITFAWGAVMIGFGFPQQWTAMIGLRMLLGIFEAGFFPGCVYLISTWYVRYDLQKRYSVFYLIGCVASACSGILAYGLMQMQGVAGYNGWRWIFIMEGILTCLVGVGGYFALVDFPDRAAKTAWRFLDERECNFIIRRVGRDRSDAEVEPFSLKKWAAAGLDPVIWGFALIFFSITTVTYAIAYCAHHSARGHGLLNRRVAMSGCATLHLRRYHHVCHCMGWGQIPYSRADSVLQRDARTDRASYHGLAFEQQRALLWRISGHSWGQCKYSHRHGLPSK